MSSPSIAEEQLLELLLHLKKTTPDQARKILNGQQHVAYALITLMVAMNAVNVEVTQKTVAPFAGSAAAAAAAAASASSASSSAPPPALPAPQPTHYPPQPPHQYPQAPMPVAPTQNAYSQYTNGQTHPPPPPPMPVPSNAYLAPPNPSAYAPPPAPNPAPDPTPALTALAGISDDQRAMIMRVVTMTPEEIGRLAPADRASIVQLRASLGLPT